MRLPLRLRLRLRQRQRHRQAHRLRAVPVIKRRKRAPQVPIRQKKHPRAAPTAPARDVRLLPDLNDIILLTYFLHISLLPLG